MCAITARNESLSEQGSRRVLVLFGSPKRNGHTGRLTDAFLGALPSNWQIEILDAYSDRVMPCNGCNGCGHTGKCILPDTGDLYGKIDGADLIVLASPVYFLSFPAPLKAVIDRLQCRWNVRFGESRVNAPAPQKTGVLLLCCGSDRGDQFDCIRRQARMIFAVLGAVQSEEVYWQGTDKGEGFRAADEKAKEAALRIAAAGR